MDAKDMPRNILVPEEVNERPKESATRQLTGRSEQLDSITQSNAFVGTSEPPQQINEAFQIVRNEISPGPGRIIQQDLPDTRFCRIVGRLEKMAAVSETPLLDAGQFQTEDEYLSYLVSKSRKQQMKAKTAEFQKFSPKYCLALVEAIEKKKNQLRDENLALEENIKKLNQQIEELKSSIVSSKKPQENFWEKCRFLDGIMKNVLKTDCINGLLQKEENLHARLQEAMRIASNMNSEYEAALRAEKKKLESIYEEKVNTRSHELDAEIAKLEKIIELRKTTEFQEKLKAVESRYSDNLACMRSKLSKLEKLHEAEMRPVLELEKQLEELENQFPIPK